MAKSSRSSTHRQTTAANSGFVALERRVSSIARAIFIGATVLVVSSASAQGGRSDLSIKRTGYELQMPWSVNTLANFNNKRIFIVVDPKNFKSDLDLQRLRGELTEFKRRLEFFGSSGEIKNILRTAAKRQYHQQTLARLINEHDMAFLQESSDDDLTSIVDS
jgi:hypothetical protein